jgi:integrase
MGISGMDDDDKWITVDKRTKKLVIRFRVKGCKKQFYIASGLKDNKRNRELVRIKRDAIATDIILNRFDLTLQSYQFKPKIKIVKKEEVAPKYQYDLSQLWEKFADYQSTQLAQTTIMKRYIDVSHWTKRLPTASLEKASAIRDHIVETRPQKMGWILINCYSQCCEWAVKSNFIPDNPFKKLKYKQPKSREKEFKAFTLEERDLIIKNFESDQKHFWAANLIKFLFFTGCRPGEAFALTWQDISSDCCKIKFSKSRNAFKVLKGTKTGRNRVFPTSEGSKLQILLLSMQRKHNSLVFVNKKGQPILSGAVFDAWKGRGKSIGVVQRLANEGKLPYLNSYATRHTFATWAITQGISPDKVALWIGDRVETVLKFYCHPEVVKGDCPDF